MRTPCREMSSSKERRRHIHILHLLRKRSSSASPGTPDTSYCVRNPLFFSFATTQINCPPPALFCCHHANSGNSIWLCGRPQRLPSPLPISAEKLPSCKRGVIANAANCSTQISAYALPPPTVHCLADIVRHQFTEVTCNVQPKTTIAAPKHRAALDTDVKHKPNTTISRAVTQGTLSHKAA